MILPTLLLLEVNQFRSRRELPQSDELPIKQPADKYSELLNVFSLKVRTKQRCPLTPPLFH